MGCEVVGRTIWIDFELLIPRLSVSQTGLFEGVIHRFRLGCVFQPNLRTEVR